MYKRKYFDQLFKRLSEPRRFIQILWGPRQTGKTTLAHQILRKIEGRHHYTTADEPLLKDQIWLEQQWEVARAQFGITPEKSRGLLVIDEVQKIGGWSETVKRLWDEDTANKLIILQIRFRALG